MVDDLSPSEEREHLGWRYPAAIADGPPLIVPHEGTFIARVVDLEGVDESILVSVRTAETETESWTLAGLTLPQWPRIVSVLRLGGLLFTPAANQLVSPSMQSPNRSR